MGSWFYLYQGSSQAPVAEEKSLPTQSEVTFVIHPFDPNEQFRCSYEIREAGNTIHSPLSNPANFTDCEYWARRRHTRVLWFLTCPIKGDALIRFLEEGSFEERVIVPLQ